MSIDFETILFEVFHLERHFEQSHFLINFVSVFSVPELLILNDCDIDRAGNPDDLRKKCGSVKELDLAQNKLQNWNEVFSILAHMPRVEFVNLSLNRLCGPIELPAECALGGLRSLVLNNTRLDWENVDALIKHLPSLEELHLSLNDYHNVLIDTLDDDVFYETLDIRDEQNNKTDDVDVEKAEISPSSGENVCSSCGVKTVNQPAKRSEFEKMLLRKKN